MKKKLKVSIVLLIIAIIIVSIVAVIFNRKSEGEILEVKTEEQLMKLYEGRRSGDSSIPEWLAYALGMPLVPLMDLSYGYSRGIVNNSNLAVDDFATTNSVKGKASTLTPSSISGATDIESAGSSSPSISKVKDYSTTNIQVENVDEADITKTDGDYIYSISDNQVIITNVKNPKKPEIAARINTSNSSYPEELILYNNKLVVISQSSSQSYYSSNQNTTVSVYDIRERKQPTLQKSYELYEPYYTSRCINGRLYVISSGYLRKENDKIVRDYKEDNQTKQIDLSDIKYLKDVDTYTQTLFSTINLENVQESVNVKSYLLDISNAYVSENSFYLLDQEYESSYEEPSLKALFGLGGIPGFFKALDGDYDYEDSGYKTKIYKFGIKEDGTIEYKANTKTDGKTINQYSLDEKNGHLRVALSDNKGTRVAIFDENLNKIGETDSLAKGENMYSSRFIGDRAYLVTYKTIDPLWVIDLSNESNPTVLGELSIPGYSTYLHPYDETHLIGIGMETKETTNRDYMGRVISTSARIVGMKMALFDVSNVKQPTQISSTVIGDSRTTSAILTNPKALLFSKEKELIAIPVNRLSTEFEVSDTSDTYSSTISAYKSQTSNYIGEGYLVYKLNLTDGFKQKGIITHEQKSKDSYDYYYSYYNTTKMLRGMYIEKNLYTVSETELKVNELETLKQIGNLKIKGE